MQHFNDEPFTLTNPPARPKPQTFETKPERQRVLFAGMECLPGQLDLLATDGYNEPEPSPSSPST